jgi:Zn-dependent metalloprotease
VKLDKFLRKLNSKNEEERLKFLWFLVGSSMLIVFVVWFINFNSNLGRLNSFNLDTSSLPKFPEAEQIDKFDEIMEQGDGILDSVVANFDQAYWQVAGQEHVQKENLFGDEAFSELKMSGVENMGEFVVVKYEHYYKGVLVYGSNLSLYFDPNKGEFIRSENSLKKGVDIGIDPEISSQKAVGNAKQQFNDSEIVFKNSSLVIVTMEDVHYLAWQLFFDNLENSSEVQIFVGAKNGGVILPRELDK